MYARNIEEEVLTFGVSGLLYRGNLLMYDRQTESLWLQVSRTAVAGPRSGSTLTALPSTITSWEKWLATHPDSLVMTDETGHRRDYSKDPYEDYYRGASRLGRLFGLGPGKEAQRLVAGVVVGDESVAFFVDELRKNGRLSTHAGGIEVTLTHDPDNDSITGEAWGEKVVPIVTYWFVWQGLYPETRRIP